jgi:hypothetical protein
MKIPDSLQHLIDAELRQLSESEAYSVPPEKRMELYDSLGPSNAVSMVDHQADSRPHLSVADRARAQISIITARKVLPLWDAACQESEAWFTEMDFEYKEQDKRLEAGYLHKRKTQPLETIFTNEVPRAFIPSHIIEMAEAVLGDRVQDYHLLHQEAGNWWNYYGQPDQMEREFCIKWAAQDALSAALNLITYNLPRPPVEDALYAFAGLFDGQGFRRSRKMLDDIKAHEFWVWWLSQGIREAISNLPDLDAK